MPNPLITIDQPPPAERPARCAPILRSVPEWFGIEEATRKYIETTARLPTWIARANDRDAGFITLERHFPKAADIHCIAAHRDFHGQGVGTALVRFAEDHLRALGVEYLQVKTLGPSKPNKQYALTKRFYERVGFVPLEELHGFWPGMPCLIMIKRI